MLFSKATATEEPAEVDDHAGENDSEEEMALEGVFDSAGTMYLRNAKTNEVYNTIRDDNGDLVLVGHWQGSKVVLSPSGNDGPSSDESGETSSNQVHFSCF